jgi:hypothetical protein
MGISHARPSNAFLGDAGLSSSAKGVGSVIAGFAGDRGVCEVSYATLLDRCAESEATLKRNVKEMRLRGWLAVRTSLPSRREDGTFEGKRNTYFLRRILGGDSTLPFVDEMGRALNVDKKGFVLGREILGDLPGAGKSNDRQITGDLHNSTDTITKTSNLTNLRHPKATGLDQRDFGDVIGDNGLTDFFAAPNVYREMGWDERRRFDDCPSEEDLFDPLPPWIRYSSITKTTTDDGINYEHVLEAIKNLFGVRFWVRYEDLEDERGKDVVSFNRGSLELLLQESNIRDMVSQALMMDTRIRNAKTRIKKPIAYYLKAVRGNYPAPSWPDRGVRTLLEVA